MSGRVVHFEIPFDDAERAQDFYRNAFGWTVMPMPDMNYTLVSTGPTSEQSGPTEPGYIGGGMTARGTVTSPVITVDVDDIDAAPGHHRVDGRVHRRRPPARRRAWASAPTSPIPRATSWVSGRTPPTPGEPGGADVAWPATRPARPAPGRAAAARARRAAARCRTAVPVRSSCCPPAVSVVRPEILRRPPAARPSRPSTAAAPPESTGRSGSPTRASTCTSAA